MKLDAEKVIEALEYIEEDSAAGRFGYEQLAIMAPGLAHEWLGFRVLLAEALVDLESYVEDYFPADLRAAYPHIARKYERDMELVNRIRAALKGGDA